jgi:multimeric flavodoxin WrbA
LREAGAGAPVLILLASARSDGDTAKAASALASRLGSDRATLVDLGTKRILPFDYSNPNQRDDFAAVTALMLEHRSIVFATPVYWYAMSGLMKTFFDRLSDLLSGRDPARRARALAGRDVRLLAVGTDPDLPDGFEHPFQMTADYLGMNWRGGYYVRSGKAADDSAIQRLVDGLSGA